MRPDVTTADVNMEYEERWKPRGLRSLFAMLSMPAIDGQHRGTLLPDAELRRQPTMNAFEHRVRNVQRNIASLVAGAAFSEHKHARIIFEKFANFVST
jgi:hypothetical protein